jgi:hypothetical protein
MNGLEKFQQAILNAAHKIVFVEGWEDKKKELGTAIRNELFGLDGPGSIEYEPTKDEKTFFSIFMAFIEIIKCYEMLSDIEIYISRLPLRKPSTIPKHRFLRYHIESYLHETYMLKERLRAFLIKIKRLYRNDSKINYFITKLEKIIIDDFQYIGVIRGIHTHKNRFKDESLDQLEALEFYKNIDDEKARILFNDYYECEFKKTRKKWIFWAKQSNSVVIKLLNFYFEIVFKLIFNENTGALKLPNK